MDAALAGNANQEGKVLMIVLLFCSVGLLGIANEYTDVLKMHGRRVEMDGTPRRYERRLEMAEHLIAETGREDWAVRLGMIMPKDDKKRHGKPNEAGGDAGQVTM